MSLKVLILILLSVGLSAIAQIAMKAGVSGAATQSSASMLGSYVAMLTAPKVLLGLACYGLGALIWLRVLSMMDVSQAYPFVALGFVLTMALGFLMLGETPHPTRLAGAGFIMIGVWLVGMR
ncbi:MAG: EamA family transporter [Sulfuricella sp.]|jgi:drug/metabolite transporter (DMT)-like permease